MGVVAEQGVVEGSGEFNVGGHCGGEGVRLSVGEAAYAGLSASGTP